MTFPTINILAVVVAGLAYFFLGALWYSPLLFANLFIKYRGMTREEIQSGGNPIEYLYTLIAGIIAALGVALFVKFAGAASAVDGAIIGLIAVLTLTATSSFTFSIYSGPHRMLWLIYTGYQAVAFIIMGIILTLWV